MIWSAQDISVEGQDILDRQGKIRYTVVFGNVTCLTAFLYG